MASCLQCSEWLSNLAKWICDKCSEKIIDVYEKSSIENK